MEHELDDLPLFRQQALRWCEFACSGEWVKGTDSGVNRANHLAFTLEAFGCGDLMCVMKNGSGRLFIFEGAA